MGRLTLVEHLVADWESFFLSLYFSIAGYANTLPPYKLLSFLLFPVLDRLELFPSTYFAHSSCRGALKQEWGILLKNLWKFEQNCSEFVT